MLIIKKLDVVARLALGAGGRGFESRRPDKHFKPLVFKDLASKSVVFSFALYAKITAKYCHILPINDYFYHKIREKFVRLWQQYQRT